MLWGSNSFFVSLFLFDSLLYIWAGREVYTQATHRFSFVANRTVEGRGVFFFFRFSCI